MVTSSTNVPNFQGAKRIHINRAVNSYCEKRMLLVVLAQNSNAATKRFDDAVIMFRRWVEFMKLTKLQLVVPQCSLGSCIHLHWATNCEDQERRIQCGGAVALTRDFFVHDGFLLWCSCNHRVAVQRIWLFDREKRSGILVFLKYERTYAFRKILGFI